jgi:chromosome partitioning protein
LISADKALASEVGAEAILKRNLHGLKDKPWDYVLIDCPPTLGIMSLNALTAAHKVLVPLETHIMAVQGLAQLLNTINTVKDRLNPSLEIDGILPCRVNKRTRLSQDIISDLRKRFNGQVYQTTIRESVKLAEAPSFGKPITIYDGKSSGAEDYRSLASEIIKRRKGK